MPANFDVEGHRGCRGLMPENTVPAMIRALSLGVNTLEMDAVITKDKQVILSHEPFFSWEISTTPDGKTFDARDEKEYNLYQMDYTTIRQWDVGMRPHPRFPRQQKMKAYKPLLSEVIDSVEAYLTAHKLPAVDYNIETKTNPSGDNRYHPLPEEFVQLLMTVIRAKKIENRVIIQSFDIRTLQIIHRDFPVIRTSLLVEGFDRRPVEQQVEKLGFVPSIYSPEYTLVNESLVSWCRQNKVLLIPWTVNERPAVDRLIRMGVNGIITDYPDLFNH